MLNVTNFFTNISSNVKLTFIALRHRNYRLWFIGQLVSLVGTWMQNTAQGFLVFQLTNSPAFLGYVAFANGLPSWLFTLYGGVIADRIPRRRLIIITQASMMILAFIIRGLKEFGEPTRKALIMDLAPENRKAGMFGLYYLIRDVVVSVAAFGGAFLWQHSPGLNLMTAFAFGTAGTIWFAVRGKDLGAAGNIP